MNIIIIIIYIYIYILSIYLYNPNSCIQRIRKITSSAFLKKNIYTAWGLQGRGEHGLGWVGRVIGNIRSNLFSSVY